MFWRYNILYVSERCFESGGRIWDHIFDEVCWCLWILSTFTGQNRLALCLHGANGKGSHESLAHIMRWIVIAAVLTACHPDTEPDPMFCLQKALCGPLNAAQSQHSVVERLVLICRMHFPGQQGVCAGIADLDAHHALPVQSTLLPLLLLLFAHISRCVSMIIALSQACQGGPCLCKL